MVGETLRALIAKAALADFGSDLAELQPLQVGIGGSGPWAQSATAAVRSWVTEMQKGSARVLVKVDLKNAFNSILRQACITGIQSYAPGLVARSHWCLSQPS